MEGIEGQSSITDLSCQVHWLWILKWGKIINNFLEAFDFNAISLLNSCRLMFWTDSGTVPRIESSWMDGTRRKVIVGDRLETPTGITVDYASGHRLYWSDSKANSIESSRPDGSDRVVVLKGDLLHPISIDVFEDQLYWVTRDSGEIFRQDKFGRGVKVRVRRSLEHATDVKIFQTQKYNTSRKFKCC